MVKHLFQKGNQSCIGRVPWNKGRKWEELYGKERADLMKQNLNHHNTTRPSKKFILGVCMTCNNYFTTNKRPNKRFCSKVCYTKYQIGKRPSHLISYNHSKEILIKISNKSIQMWKDKKYTNRRFEIMHPKIKEKEILDLWQNGLNIEKIKNLANLSSVPIRRILFEAGYTQQDIKDRHRISLSNTRKSLLKEGKIKMPREQHKIWRRTQVIPKKDSSIELKIQAYLKLLGVEYLTHQYIQDIEHGYQCDILIPSMKLVIECDGDYWHSYPIGRDIDHIRTKELIDNGFKVLRLWEKEIKVMSLDTFKDKLDKYGGDLR